MSDISDYSEANDRPAKEPDKAEHLTMTPEREDSLMYFGFVRNKTAVPIHKGYKYRNYLIQPGEGWIRNGEVFTNVAALAWLHDYRKKEGEV